MFDRHFQFDDSDNNFPLNLLGITKILGPLLDKSTREIFQVHARRLMTESMDYVIPAVWGVGLLDETQQEIAKTISPLIETITETLNIRHLTVAQEFALGYLIRETIISKIIFMVAMAGTKR